MRYAYDIAVVGAGPAGSTAARYAALGGARTLLIDRRREIGRPVQCGEFLPGLEEVERMFPRAGPIRELFPRLASLVRTRTRSLRICSPNGREYEVPFDGLVLDRDRFDGLLARAAEEAGAELRTGTRVTALRGEILETDGGEVRARVIIGADGPRSVVARDGGFAPGRSFALGLQYLTRGLVGDPRAVEMYFGRLAPGGYAWVIPKGADRANVGVGVRPPKAKLARRALEAFIGARERRCGRRAKRQRLTAGLIPVGGPLAETVRGNVILAGDAAGQLMACNGGGVPTAAICGRIAGQVAAEHVRAGLPASRYEHLWREVCGRELESALTTRRIFDAAIRSPTATELAMRLAGPQGMRNLMTCLPWYRAVLRGAPRLGA